MHAAEALKPAAPLASGQITSIQGTSDKNPAAASLAQPTPIQKTLARISDLEALGGAYANELGEAYLDLGNMHAAEGQHENAIEYFAKAQQVVRIHAGLTDPAQLKILGKMIDSSFALESWETADDEINLYWHITSRSFGPGSTERLHALEQLETWQLQAASDHLLAILTTTLDNTARLYEVEIGSFEDTGTPDIQTAEIKAALLLGKAELLYQRALLTESKSLTSFHDSSMKMTMQRQCLPNLQPSGKISQTCISTTAPNINYYIDQTKNKDITIFGYLNEMKASVLEAYGVLMQFKSMSAGKLSMLTRIHAMTNDYNEIAARYTNPLAHEIGAR